LFSDQWNGHFTTTLYLTQNPDAAMAKPTSPTKPLSRQNSFRRVSKVSEVKTIPASRQTSPWLTLIG
jgi:hypothetical protein